MHSDIQVADREVLTHSPRRSHNPCDDTLIEGDTYMNSRKYLISVGLAIGAAFGAAGIAAATSSPSNTPAPVVQSQITVDTPESPSDTPDAVETETAGDTPDAVESQTESDSADEVDGVDCEDGIITATGAECDGGPSANATDDENESDDGDVETNDDGAVQSGTNGG